QGGGGERLVVGGRDRGVEGDAGRAVDWMHGNDAWGGTPGREARVGRLEQALAAALADERVEVGLVGVLVRVRVAVALRRPVCRAGERVVAEVEVRASVRVGDEDATLLVDRGVVEVEQVAARIR